MNTELVSKATRNAKVAARIARVGIRWMTIATGFGVLASGLAHFIFPGMFQRVTRPVFPDDTVYRVQVHGAAEMAIGAALIVKETRPAGLVGGAVYGVYLAERTLSWLSQRLRRAAPVPAPASPSAGAGIRPTE
ncbi:hypothetical protein ACFWXB_16090 [Tsukamurella tyrosinosolvens]|uniref:hypothetical protein n=1 Tax=Tsukamurella tyrosinosolvens TaxID=57704 RepID=UPI003675381E